MRGRYGVLHSPERSWKRNIDQSVLATSITRKVASNTVRAGTNTTIDLNLPTPIYAMFFRARHVEASRIGDFSNYTTNPHDRFAGDDPIESVTHIYNTDEIEVQDLSDLSAVQGWYNASSCPREPGYGMYAKSGRPCQNLPDTGMLYNKDLAGSIRFRLASSRLRSSDDHDDAEKIFKQYTQSREASSSGSDFDSYEVALYLQTAYLITYHKNGHVEINDGHLSERNWSLPVRLNDTNNDHNDYARPVASTSSLN